MAFALISTSQGSPRRDSQTILTSLASPNTSLSQLPFGSHNHAHQIFPSVILFPVKTPAASKHPEIHRTVKVKLRHSAFHLDLHGCFSPRFHTSQDFFYHPFSQDFWWKWFTVNYTFLDYPFTLLISCDDLRDMEIWRDTTPSDIII